MAAIFEVHSLKRIFMNNFFFIAIQDSLKSVPIFNDNST